MADIKVSIASPVIEKEEINAVIDVMKSGMIAQGPKVIEFEEEFAKYVDFCIACSSFSRWNWRRR